MTRAIAIRIAQITHLVALAIWLGSVAMSGVVAAIVFPLMRDLSPTLAYYPDYDGDHALLAAGLIASKVFFTVDTIQFICASIALGTLVVMVVAGFSLNTVARVLRVILLCITLALLSYHIFLFMPGLMGTLNGYWDNAKMGNTGVADQFKNKFLDSHGAASNILSALTLLVLLNLILAGITLTVKERTDEGATS